MTKTQRSKLRIIREQTEQFRFKSWNDNWNTNKTIVLFEHMADIIEELCLGYDPDFCPCVACKLKRLIKRLLRINQDAQIEENE